MTIAGFDYFGLPGSKRFRAVAAEIYLELANFYAARSRMTGADGAFNQADIKRALIYIDRACSTDPSNARTFSQRAALVLVNVPKRGDRPTKEQLEKAESDLDQSLALKPTDVRALYNLAWIARRRDKLVRAIEILTRIIDLQKTLDQDDRGRRVIDAFTNRACYRALSLNPLPPDAAQDTEIRAKTALILADCQAACEEGKLFNLKEYCRKGFKREFSQGGDLYAVRQLLEAQAVDEVIACV
jgi:tetratricopeptide (TPR) repeat protein